MSKQSVLDLLLEKLYAHHRYLINEEVDPNFIKQLKALEKQQILDAYVAGEVRPRRYSLNTSPEHRAEDYFNSTYI